MSNRLFVLPFVFVVSSYKKLEVKEDRRAEVFLLVLPSNYSKKGYPSLIFNCLQIFHIFTKFSYAHFYFP